MYLYYISEIEGKHFEDEFEADILLARERENPIDSR